MAWLLAAGLITLGLPGCSAVSSSGPLPETRTTAGEPAAEVARVAPQQSKPKVTHRTVRKRDSIAFGARVRRTAALDKGVTRLKQRGRPGVRVHVVQLRLKDGVVVDRKKVRTYVARRPVPRVTLRGTHVDPPPAPVGLSSRCDSNYAGGCVPIASDVDCGGGSGNGPAYVYGAVKVVGSDIYDLDADGDGYGCE